MDLYYMPASAACRAVQMTAEAVGCHLNLKMTDLLSQEQLRPSFIKINPQHTIPTLVDNGFALWESRAICIYLVEKYGGAKKNKLYPKDIKKRSLINQRLYFDAGTLYTAFGNYYYPQIFAQQAADPEKFKAIEKAMDFLNIFIGEQKYAAGDELTIADICLVATISTFEVSGFEFEKFPNISRWYNLCKATIPGYAINQAGAQEFKKFFN